MTLIVAILIWLSFYFNLLPIKDRRERKRGFPWMTLGLVVINVLIFIGVTLYLSRFTDEDARQRLYPYLEVSKLILNKQGLGLLSVVTSGFLHGSLGHLWGNMFALWFFGRKVEDATGHVRFLLLYLLCLFTSSLFDVTTGLFRDPAAAEIPSLGASGAIFGIMTAYLFLYADERVLTLVSLWIIPLPIPFWLPAWVYIVQNLLLNAFVGELVQAELIQTNIGVFAHLGGAAGGLLCIYFFLHPDVFAQRR
jgi:membrane associated rhomboid family serine protease